MGRRVRVAVLAALALGAPAGATTGTSTDATPTVTFATPGSHDVTLQACNGTHCSTLTRTVVVLDPRPAITGATATPVVAVPAPVRLAATGTGKPALVFTWNVYAQASASPVATLSGAAVSLDTTSLAAGSYTAVLTLANAYGAAASAPLPILIEPDPRIFSNGFEESDALSSSPPAWIAAVEPAAAAQQPPP